MPVPTNEVTMGRQLETAENGPLTLEAAGGTQDLFIITGGPIYLERLTGIITTEIDCTATCIANLVHDPETTAAVDMCLAAGGLNIDGLLVDSQLNIDGVPGNAMVATIVGVVLAPSFSANHMILAPGTVSLFTVGAAIVGAITWTIVYRPLGFGISVVAA